MMMMTEFLGHSIGYWLELESLVVQKGVSRLIQEIVDLRSKVSFYESRVEEMERFRKLADSE
jgi:hypothetical protein